jgi:starvation-inducible DNA-binding protein
METIGKLNKYTAGQAEAGCGLEHDAVHDIERELRHLLADTFALYIKTKSFHWHMKGRHFRDYHLLLDEHADQLFGITDEIAERARKLGANALRSIGDIARHQRLEDCDEQRIAPEEMLKELRSDNYQSAKFLRATHEICERHNDVATASLIENWIDQAERRTWFLAEIVEG